MKKKEEDLNIKRNKIILLIMLVIILVLALALIISKIYGDYSNVGLKKNNKTIFSISDLVVNDMEYGYTEKQVKEKMGNPKKEKNLKNDIYNYKELYYNGIIFTFKENYSDYILVKVEITNNKYTISRKIKVGDNILDVINSYKVENKKGTYIYGNYSTDSLNENEITDNIYFAVRSRNEIVYINRDATIDGLKSNIARLNISYKHGKVTKIIWSYDFK